MTHSEYVAKVRARIADIAQQMLERRLSFLEGTVEICKLRAEAEVPSTYSDFDVLAMVDSEIDDLPVGSVRALWSASALQRLEPELSRSEDWAYKTGSEACRAIVHRFRG